MELEGDKYSPAPCTRGFCCDHPQDFRSVLTSTYFVCTRRVFGGTHIEPTTSVLESNALITRLPTALATHYKCVIASKLKCGMKWMPSLKFTYVINVFSLGFNVMRQICTWRAKDISI
ncbi:hypothetical protein TNCV_1026381 [Trichonephila clavipes]|nr:hypothetical protein TNCV_1026381 [Trichonephila clavipes]